MATRHTNHFLWVLLCVPLSMNIVSPSQLWTTVVIVLLYMLSHEYDSINCKYLACHVRDQYVPGSQVSVDKPPAREVVETQSHLLGEVQ